MVILSRFATGFFTSSTAPFRDYHVLAVENRDKTEQNDGTDVAKPQADRFPRRADGLEPVVASWTGHQTQVGHGSGVLKGSVYSSVPFTGLPFASGFQPVDFRHSILTQRARFSVASRPGLSRSSLTADAPTLDRAGRFHRSAHLSGNV